MIKAELQLAALETRHKFSQSLGFYLMGVSGNPEAQEQKAFVKCLMAEFPIELGEIEIPNKKTPHMPDIIYRSLIVATADFIGAGKYKGSAMQNFNAMGYQKGTLDVTIMYPASGYHGFTCEMKCPGGHYTKSGKIGKPGKPTREQILTIDWRNMQGYYACVGMGFSGALGHWLTYLGK